jgi:hypothetical protein
MIYISIVGTKTRFYKRQIEHTKNRQKKERLSVWVYCLSVYGSFTSITDCRKVFFRPFQHSIRELRLMHRMQKVIQQIVYFLEIID